MQRLILRFGDYSLTHFFGRVSMVSFTSITQKSRCGSSLTLAIALICGTALTAGVLEAPAAAQKKDAAKEAKANYSKDFVKAYTAANAFMTAEPADTASAKAALPSVVSAISTADDRMATGQYIVTIGQATSDDAMTRQGLEMMLASGKVSPENRAAYLVNVADLARRAGDMDAARTNFMAAHDAGHVKDDLPPIIASTYFDENRFDEGIGYLRGLVDAQIAAGQTPNPMWINYAFSSAYNNDQTDEAMELAGLAVQYHPNEKNWRNAIAVQRNLSQMSDDTMLDLMRLAKRTNTLQDARDYGDYIETADARRHPGEVDVVLREGIAAGVLKSSDPFVAEARQTVDAQLAADRAELPSLERDALKSDATAV
ncbi:MAG: hypothetical protein WA948_00235, partial [Pontixanthobacter sp.]